MNRIASPRARRSGQIIVLTAILMVVMMAFLALSLDVGYMYAVRSQMQRSADAAAVAATWELLDLENFSLQQDATVAAQRARDEARDYAGYNQVTNMSPQLASSDVVVGHLSNPSDPYLAIDTQYGGPSNAVQVLVRRTAAQNGEVPLFFARAIGFHKIATQAKATAALISNVGGFVTPSDGSNLGILPFALDEQTWNGLMAGGGTDTWKYKSDTETVVAGSDGIKEINLYPQGTGSPGNRGTIDIGGANNSTSDISRQIRDGISPNDMEEFEDDNRTLVFNTQGKLWLNGDTGISAAVKDDLAAIKGEPRIIPIFRTVAGNGNNAEYTIIAFAGVRVMEVKLTGAMSGKKVMIQPCKMVAKGAVAGGSTTTSYFVYSPPWLVR